METLTQPREWLRHFRRELGGVQLGQVCVAPRMRAERHAWLGGSRLQLFRRRDSPFRRWSAQRLSLLRGRLGDGVVGPPQTMQCVVSNSSIESCDGVGQSVPPACVPAQEPWSHEDRSWKAAGGELRQAVTKGTRVRIVKRDRSARASAVHWGLKRVERHDIVSRDQRIEEPLEVICREVQRAIPRRPLPGCDDVVEREHDALSSVARPREAREP